MLEKKSIEFIMKTVESCVNFSNQGVDGPRCIDFSFDFRRVLNGCKRLQKSFENMHSSRRAFIEPILSLSAGYIQSERLTEYVLVSDLVFLLLS